MKIGITVWKNRISPLFDSAQMLLIAEIKNGTITGKHYEPFHLHLPSSKAIQTYNMGVEVVICGAISYFLANMIEAYGIRIIPFVAGDVNHVLDAYLKGNLPTQKFQMPGCGIRRRRRFRSAGSLRKI